MMTDYAPSAPAALGWLGTARDNWARYRVYRRTLSELNALSGRELDDLGIARSMITRLALEAAYGRAA